jgi:hypothetical protein
MPVNFQQIHARITEIGAGASDRRKTLDERKGQAHHWLNEYSAQPEFLRQKAEAAKAVDPNIRCAVPLSEPLDTSHPAPTLDADATLIAADGSQINPDRHATVQFGVINVGTIIMKRNSGKSPEVFTTSELFYGNELEDNKLTSEGAISLQRDLHERTAIDDLSAGLEGPIVNIADGTLEIWGAKDIEDARAYEKSVHSYLTVLSRLQSRGIVTAGYVDKPSANLVVRLLEIADAPRSAKSSRSTPVGPDFASAPAQSRQELRDFHPLQGVNDLWLFGFQNDGFRLLGPGERSAVFKLQSSSEKYYKGDLALHFFYLNVSDASKYPQIARVEIPAWVTADQEKLDLLHAVLLEQCRMLGSRPYPYLLNRAHEIAVVGQEEKEQIEQLLALESRRQGEAVGNPSNKQVGKDSLAMGRKRYGK